MGVYWGVTSSNWTKGQTTSMECYGWKGVSHECHQRWKLVNSFIIKITHVVSEGEKRHLSRRISFHGGLLDADFVGTWLWLLGSGAGLRRNQERPDMVSREGPLFPFYSRCLMYGCMDNGTPWLTLKHPHSPGTFRRLLKGHEGKLEDSLWWESNFELKTTKNNPCSKPTKTGVEEKSGR